MPSLRALRAAAALPRSVRGPVDFCALVRLAMRFASLTGRLGRAADSAVAAADVFALSYVLAISDVISQGVFLFHSGRRPCLPVLPDRNKLSIRYHRGNRLFL